MKASIVLGLAAAASTAGAFQVQAPFGPRRAALALRSTAPGVGTGSVDALGDALVAELQATAVTLDKAQQAQTLALLAELRAKGTLSQAQYDGEVAKVTAGTALYLKPQATPIPVPPTLEMMHRLEAQGHSYLGSLRALALENNNEQSALARLEVLPQRRGPPLQQLTRLGPTCSGPAPPPLHPSPPPAPPPTAPLHCHPRTTAHRPPTPERRVCR